MMNRGLNTLNLVQLKGGTVIKERDRSSVFTFAFQEGRRQYLNLAGKEASIAIYTDTGKYRETKKAVDSDGTVSFSFPGNIAQGKYRLEISCDGYVFPSDESFIITFYEGYNPVIDKEEATGIRITTREILEEEAVKAVKSMAKDELKGDKGDKGDPLRIKKIENLSNGDIGLTFDDDKTTTILIPAGKDVTVKVSKVDGGNEVTFSTGESFIVKDGLYQIKDEYSGAFEALAHLSDTGKDLTVQDDKLLRGEKEVGIRVKNSGHVYSIPENIKKAKIYFKAQSEEPTADNRIFFRVGQDENKDKEQQFVSRLDNRTRHYMALVDLSQSHDIVISTVQAWDKNVRIWDFDWREVL